MSCTKILINNILKIINSGVWLGPQRFEVEAREGPEGSELYWRMLCTRGARHIHLRACKVVHRSVCVPGGMCWSNVDQVRDVELPIRLLEDWCQTRVVRRLLVFVHIHNAWQSRVFRRPNWKRAIIENADIIVSVLHYRHLWYDKLRHLKNEW